MALDLMAIDPPALAERLRVPAHLLRVAREIPRLLPNRARLRLADLAGATPNLAPLACELRRRTLATLSRNTGASPSERGR